jgi:hypothetical protein
MSIIGDATFDLGSTLELEVDDLGAGQYDQLDITGNFFFSGLFQLDFMNGFAPTTGTVFDFIDFSGLARWNPSAVLFTGIQSGNLFRFDVLSDRIDMVALNDWVSTSAPGPPGNPSAVPEPSSLLLIGSGLLYGVRGYRRRARSRN